MDLIFASIVTSPDPCSIGGEDHVPNEWVYFGEKRVHFDGVCISHPCFPVFFARPGSLRQDSRLDRFPYSHEITSEINFWGKWDGVQEFCCGKKMLKYTVRVGAWRRKVTSVSNREATPAILFKTPAIDIISRGSDLQICCCRARAQSKCPAMSNFAENYLDHCTVEELSHLMPAWT